ncbi:hypothetical protein D3C76_1355330 [compost metagenome]
MNSCSGSALSSRRSISNCRPRFQVVIRTNSAAPASTGKAPPCSTLGRLAAKNSESTSRKLSISGTATSGDQRHSRSITTLISTVVQSMVPVTATPYAEASAPEDSKPITSSTTATIRAQLTPAM